jgi:hypothetical protein
MQVLGVVSPGGLAQPRPGWQAFLSQQIWPLAPHGVHRSPLVPAAPRAQARSGMQAGSRALHRPQQRWSGPPQGSHVPTPQVTAAAVQNGGASPPASQQRSVLPPQVPRPGSTHDPFAQAPATRPLEHGAPGAMQRVSRQQPPALQVANEQQG